MQVNGMSSETFRASVDQESTCKKCCIAIGSIIHMLAAAAVAIVYMLWWANVRKTQEWWDSNCELF